MLQASGLLAAKGLGSILPLMAQHGVRSAGLISSVPSVGLASSFRLAPLDTFGSKSTFASAATAAPSLKQGVETLNTTGASAEGKSEAELKQATVSYLLMHPVYKKEYTESVRPTHVPVEKVHQKLGLFTVQVARRCFDLATGYNHDTMTEAKWLQRIIFLETVAGVPGMVAGMLRHMKSLRTMQRDNGWIHTLLEEAENERMHLLTFLKLRQPGILFRAAVIGAQGLFFNIYLLAYILYPKACHSFVGYLEEEAVKTYTYALKDIDAGKVWKDALAPEIAIEYWKLPKEATMRDLILAVRADEACHSYVNHTFAGMKPSEPNPFGVGNHMVP